MKHLELRRAGIVPALLLGLTSAAILAGCNSGGGSVPGGGSGGDVLATVGGQDITRDELRNYLEGNQGSQGLQTLIDHRLLQQSLKTKGVDVTDEEVTSTLQDQLKQLQEQDKLNPPAPGATPAAQSLQAILDEKGPRLTALQEDVRNNLTNYKLLTQNIKVTDDQLKTYFEKNRARYDTPARVQWGALVSSTAVRANTLLTQLRNKSRTFKQLVDEQSKANDRAAQGSFYDRPVDPTVLPPALKTAVNNLKPGAFSNVVTLGGAATGGPSIYLVLTVVKRVPAQKADFNALKTRLERAYKLEQLQKTLPASPGAANPLTGAPSDPITEKQSQVLRDLQHAGNVVISNPVYAPLAENYKPAPSASGAAGNTATGNTAGASGNAASGTANAAG